MIRFIARLDIKGPNLIKGIRFEGVRVIGNPQTYAKKYYEEGIDEIIYIDTVASLYNRIGLQDLLEKTIKDVFIPITAGGGVRSVDDVKLLLRSGADKVAINTAAIKRPKIITDISNTFGSQCVVSSIQACKQSDKSWEAYYDNGREHSGYDVVEWAKEVVRLGAGEILLSSVDKDGTSKGLDIDLIKLVSESVSIPVIASSGMGKPQDFIDVIKYGNADAVASGFMLHYNKSSIKKVKEDSKKEGIDVR